MEEREEEEEEEEEGEEEEGEFGRRGRDRIDGRRCEESVTCDIKYTCTNKFLAEIKHVLMY